jgi:conjugal transfer ATP-binding protein TraC
MLAEFLQRILLGPREYLKHSDLEKMTNRSPFSSYLNYLAYDPELEIYLNQDGSIGFLWECSPVIYAGPKTITALEGLFRAGLPKDSVIQLLFHADSHIEPILARYQDNRTRSETIVSTNTNAVVSFLVDGKKGLKACSNIPVRHFRLFVAVKYLAIAARMAFKKVAVSGPRPSTSRSLFFSWSKTAAKEPNRPIKSFESFLVSFR